MDAISDTKFSKIFWYYDVWQNTYNKTNVEYRREMPDMNNFDGVNPVLIIIDDLMREADERITDIFTKRSHHFNISVFFITQNISHQGKVRRDISFNTKYVIYFKNPRDKAQISYLSRQLCPENTKFLQENT